MTPITVKMKIHKRMRNPNLATVRTIAGIVPYPAPVSEMVIRSRLTLLRSVC
jgi:hypothetical protein